MSKIYSINMRKVLIEGEDFINELDASEPNFSLKLSSLSTPLSLIENDSSFFMNNSNKILEKYKEKGIEYKDIMNSPEKIVGVNNSNLLHFLKNVSPVVKVNVKLSFLEQRSFLSLYGEVNFNESGEDLVVDISSENIPLELKIRNKEEIIALESMIVSDIVEKRNLAQVSLDFISYAGDPYGEEISDPESYGYKLTSLSEDNLKRISELIKNNVASFINQNSLKKVGENSKNASLSFELIPNEDKCTVFEIKASIADDEKRNMENYLGIRLIVEAAHNKKQILRDLSRYGVNFTSDQITVVLDFAEPNRIKPRLSLI